jgi:hypothetical protein
MTQNQGPTNLVLYNANCVELLDNFIFKLFSYVSLKQAKEGTGSVLSKNWANCCIQIIRPKQHKSTTSYN